MEYFPEIIGYFYKMSFRYTLLLCCALLLPNSHLHSQSADTVFQLSAVVYDDLYIPVFATHVININTQQGDVTDTLGIFRLAVHPSDTLMIRNIAFRDTLVSVEEVQQNLHIVIKRRHYQLEEARIFEWGATYEDFREAFIDMPVQQSLGASLGLPQQDPEKVPMEMDEKAVKSAGLLFTSPISFFYQNFNKHAKSARKAYWLKKNQTKQDQFETIVSPENISEITGLSGAKLDEFMRFLSRRMVCDLNCTELAIYSEIHGLWNVFQDLEDRGMLEGEGGD